MIASFITASVNAAFNSDYIGSASLNNAYGDWTEAICTSLMIRSNFTNHKFGAQRNCIPQFRYAIRTFNYAIYTRGVPPSEADTLLAYKSIFGRAKGPPKVLLNAISQIPKSDPDCLW